MDRTTRAGEERQAMLHRFRRQAVPDEVLERAGLRRGEKVLAATRSRDGAWLIGTRDALLIVPPAPGEEGSQVVEPEPRVVEPVETIPWQQVESADWSRDDDRLRVREVGEYGRPRPVHVLVLDDPGRLLELVRERVTASVVLQRRVTVSGAKGLSVVARRAPDGTGDLVWSYELDAGLDPEDPEVRRLAELGLQAAAEELGLG